MKKRGLLVLTATISTLMSFSTLAGEWKQNDTGWWYDNGNATYENNGWSWINERWYYFTPEGYCLMNTTTPDGFQVDENGAWLIDGVVQTKGSDVAVISPILRFVKPEGFYLATKLKDKAYMGSESSIWVYDVDYKEDIKQRYGENEHVEMNLDHLAKNFCAKSIRQFHSGEWTRYDYYPAGPSYYYLQFAMPVMYVRLVDSRLHKVEFKGYITGDEADAIMSACVQQNLT